MADRFIKVVVIGEASVGKTNLLSRYTRGEFFQANQSTVGPEFFTKVLSLQGGSSVKVHLWDTAGQERYAPLCTHIFEGAHGALVVYDITQQRSFDRIAVWISELRKRSPRACIILVGNKLDLEERRQVTTETANRFARENGIGIALETSAQSNIGVTKAFEALVTDVYSTTEQTQLQFGAIRQPVEGRRVTLTETRPELSEASGKKRRCWCF